MRVLHVIPAVAPRYGGPSSAVSAMCRSLGACGVETLIATTNADGPGSLAVATGAPLNFQGTETIFFPRQLSKRFGYSYPLARWLKTGVKAFDVVHIHAVFSHSCIASARACRRSGVPYIVRPLGNLDPWSLNQKPWRKRLMWHAAVGRMLRQAAAIHYTTIEEQRLAESTNGLERGVVIPLGITVDDSTNVSDRESFRRSYPVLGDSPYILVLSRLHPKKNLESLIEAFTALSHREGFASWRLVIAGDGEVDCVAALKRLAQNSNGVERVIFTGWLSNGVKAAALNDAQLLALPSLQENFGLCVAEALACGVPVVVSRQVNLAADVLAAGAGWVTGLGPGELESALAAAMSDAAERERRGQAGRKFVAERFGFPQVTRELVALYNCVAAANAQRAVISPTYKLTDNEFTHSH